MCHVLRSARAKQAAKEAGVFGNSHVTLLGDDLLARAVRQMELAVDDVLYLLVPVQSSSAFVRLLRKAKEERS